MQCESHHVIQTAMDKKKNSQWENSKEVVEIGNKEVNKGSISGCGKETNVSDIVNKESTGYCLREKGITRNRNQSHRSVLEMGSSFDFLVSIPLKLVL